MSCHHHHHKKKHKKRKHPRDYRLYENIIEGSGNSRVIVDNTAVSSVMVTIITIILIIQLQGQ